MGDKTEMDHEVVVVNSQFRIFLSQRGWSMQNFFSKVANVLSYIFSMAQISCSSIFFVDSWHMSRQGWLPWKWHLAKWAEKRFKPLMHWLHVAGHIALPWESHIAYEAQKTPWHMMSCGYMLRQVSDPQKGRVTFDTLMLLCHRFWMDIGCM